MQVPLCSNMTAILSPCLVEQVRILLAVNHYHNKHILGSEVRLQRRGGVSIPSPFQPSGVWGLDLQEVIRL